MYKLSAFEIRNNLFTDPLCFTGRNRTLFPVPQRFPGNFPQKSTAFRTYIVYFKPVCNVLKLLRSLGCLLCTQVNAYRRGTDSYKQTYSQELRTSFAQKSDHNAYHTGQRKRKRLE